MLTIDEKLQYSRTIIGQERFNANQLSSHSMRGQGRWGDFQSVDSGLRTRGSLLRLDNNNSIDEYERRNPET